VVGEPADGESSGLVGFVLGLLGVMLVRTSSAKIFGEASYMIASSLWSIGMVVWGLDLLRAKVFRKSPPASGSRRSSSALSAWR
jgi:hypothetical protein